MHQNWQTLNDLRYYYHIIHWFVINFFHFFTIIIFFIIHFSSYFTFHLFNFCIYVLIDMIIFLNVSKNVFSTNITNFFAILKTKRQNHRFSKYKSFTFSIFMSYINNNCLLFKINTIFFNWMLSWTRNISLFMHFFRLYSQQTIFWII